MLLLPLKMIEIVTQYSFVRKDFTKQGVYKLTIKVQSPLTSCLCMEEGRDCISALHGWGKAAPRLKYKPKM